MVIKRFDPVSCAKIAGTLYAIVGLFGGGILSLIALLGGATSAKPGGVALGALLGVGAIIFVPIVYGGLGFIFTILAALLYNGIASLVGGMRIEVE
jgi:hypothetical protein